MSLVLKTPPPPSMGERGFHEIVITLRILHKLSLSQESSELKKILEGIFIINISMEIFTNYSKLRAFCSGKLTQLLSQGQKMIQFSKGERVKFVHILNCPFRIGF